MMQKLFLQKEGGPSCHFNQHVKYCISCDEKTEPVGHEVPCKECGAPSGRKK